MIIPLRWLWYILRNYLFFKNVSSSISQKKHLSVCLYEILRKFFLTHSFMNRFWWKFIRILILILRMRKYFTLISMTSKVIEGHKSSSNFSVNPTLPLMDGPLMLPSQIMCISLFFLTLHLVLYSPLFLLLSLYIPLYLPLLLYANINLHS